MSHTLNLLKNLLIAVLLTAAATSARYWFDPAIGSRAPLLIHLLAVVIAAQIAGTTSGLAATGLAILLIDHFAPASDRHMHAVLAIFGAVGAAASVSGGWRKRAEDRIRRVRYNLETAQRIANIGSWQSDQQGKLWWSEETYRIFGVSPGTVLHTDDFYKLVHPADRDKVREAVRCALEQHDDYDIEHRIVRKSDGAVRCVHQRAKALPESTARLIGSIQDVTEARNTHADLVRMSRTMSLALDATRSGAWLWNLETGDLTWTDSYFQLLGVDPATKPSPDVLYSIVHPEDLNALQRSVEDAMRGRVEEFRMEFRIQRADGVRWFERRGRVFSNGEGKPIQLVGITTDITERKILRGLLPTCAYCKRIRDERDHWQSLERYISEHSDARFSHGMCPECYEKAMQEQHGG